MRMRFYGAACAAVFVAIVTLMAWPVLAQEVDLEQVLRDKRAALGIVEKASPPAGPVLGALPFPTLPYMADVDPFWEPGDLPLKLGQKVTTTARVWTWPDTHVGAFHLLYDYDRSQFRLDSFKLDAALGAAGFGVWVNEDLQVDQTTEGTDATLGLLVIGDGVEPAPATFWVGELRWKVVGCGESAQAVNVGHAPSSGSFSHMATIPHPDTGTGTLASLMVPEFLATIPNPEDFGVLFHGEAGRFYVPCRAPTGDPGKRSRDVIEAVRERTWSTVKGLYQ